LLGGSALINLFLNSLIFLTALFYLLSSSKSDYKPIEFFRTTIPNSNRFLVSVEDSIASVFTASLKMALFYGLWTFLIHSLFRINIVFVPSLLAAFFGAVPVLMPYWYVLT
jgi:predicted PurR-regulated permease PerM